MVVLAQPACMFELHVSMVFVLAQFAVNLAGIVGWK